MRRIARFRSHTARDDLSDAEDVPLRSPWKTIAPALGVLGCIPLNALADALTTGGPLGVASMWRWGGSDKR